jgi:hypothetical protein
MRHSINFIIAVMASVLSSCQSPAAHPYETIDVPGPAFTVRLSAFHEENGWPVAGAYYRFESLPRDGKISIPAMEFRHDDPVPLPGQNVRFVTADIAYLFMGWKYAVTTDRGKSWAVWNAETDLPNWQCCNYELIARVEVESNGIGKMFLRPIPGRRGEVNQLFTSDFGRHWIVAP